MTITILSQKFRLTQEIRASIMRIDSNFGTFLGRKMAETAVPKVAEEELLRMTADVVAAYVSNNTLPTAQLAEVINAVYSSLRSLEGQSTEPQPEPLKPAVPIRKSITADFLVCLEDGKKLKMLKRHLRSTYNLTPDGRAELCRAAFRIRQKDRARARRRATSGTKIARSGGRHEKIATTLVHSLPVTQAFRGP
jgi:predicted transcriptional regulator